MFPVCPIWVAAERAHDAAAPTDRSAIMVYIAARHMADVERHEHIQSGRLRMRALRRPPE